MVECGKDIHGIQEAIKTGIITRMAQSSTQI